MERCDQLEDPQVLTLGVFLKATRASFCHLRWINKEALGMVLVQLACIDVPIRGLAVFLSENQAHKCCALIHPSLELCQWQRGSNSPDQGLSP